MLIVEFTVLVVSREGCDVLEVVRLVIDGFEEIFVVQLVGASALFLTSFEEEHVSSGIFE